MIVLAVTPYGIQRDAFLYFAMGDHLRLWHMDFPPLIAIMGNLQTAIFGHTLAAARVFPALEGCAILITAALIARELGGGRFAQGLATLPMFTAGIFLRPANLFQPVVLDQLWWTLALLFLARAARADAGGDARSRAQCVARVRPGDGPGPADQVQHPVHRPGDPVRAARHEAPAVVRHALALGRRCHGLRHWQPQHRGADQPRLPGRRPDGLAEGVAAGSRELRVVRARPADDDGPDRVAGLHRRRRRTPGLETPAALSSGGPGLHLRVRSAHGAPRQGLLHSGPSIPPCSPRERSGSTEPPSPPCRPCRACSDGASSPA